MKKTATIAIMLALTACTHKEMPRAMMDPAKHMAKGKEMSAPEEYVLACRVEACIDNATMAVIPLTPFVLSNLQKVLNEARQVRRVNMDKEIWTSTPITTLNGEPVGNCVSCSRTMQIGMFRLYPKFQAAFRLAETNPIFVNGKGAYVSHMVLTVETTEGTLACDCNYSACLPWDRVTRNWFARELPNGSWERFHDW